jgi:pimeloyl-ACP methyl ester carboxylesterase
MTESFFAERGLYYRVNEFEPGRKTLVFVHGLTGSSSAWKKYEERFGKTYDILSFDLCGHGKSVRKESDKDYVIERFADDLKELLNFLHIEKCVLIGHSFGAVVALEFLLQNPDKVMSAIFLSPDFYTKGISLTKITFPIIVLVSYIARIFPVFKHKGRHIDYDRYRNTGDWNLRRMFADIPNTGLHVYLYCLRQLYGFDYRNRLKDIGVPVLIIHGKRDTLVPYQHSIDFAKEIQGSRLVILDEANHILILNNFEEVAKSITDFV